MWFRIIFCGAVVIGSVGHADGPLPQLSDPIVVPAPANSQPLSAITSNGLSGSLASSQRSLGGYPVNIAWDHVAVGAAILSVMYLLGEDASASGTF